MGRRRFIFALLLAALIQLTRPDGHPIWLSPAQIVSVTRAVPLERPQGAATDVQTLSGLYGVREDPAEVVRRLQAAE